MRELVAPLAGFLIGVGLIYVTSCGGGPFAPPIPDLTTTTLAAPAPEPPSLPPDQP